MPLNQRQISELARAIDAYMSLPALILLADEIGIDLGNVAPDGSVQTRAEALLKRLNDARPPRDRELLEAMSAKGPGEIRAALKTLVDQLLTPTYHPANARDALLLGRIGFFGRDDLRMGMAEFVQPSHVTSRVLIIQGSDPGGKSYSWEYLRHLAVQSGAVPQPLRLKKDGPYDPRSFVYAVGELLELGPATLPELADDPQKMRMNALMNWFQGKLVNLRHPYWLVIDDLNEPEVTPEVRACAYALASTVERLKPDNLWVALLGYNDPITDMRYCIRDRATFPTQEALAKNFVSLAALSPVPLVPAKAAEYAQLLFSKYAAIDREAMEELTAAAEGLGQKLLQGLQP